MTLRARLTLWNALVLAVLLSGSGILLRVRVQAQLAGALDRELEQRARFFPPGRFELPPPLPPEIPIPIFRAGGVPVRGGGRALDPDAVSAALAGRRPVWTTRGDRRLYTHPLLTSEGPAAFQTDESLVPLRTEIDTLTRALLTLLPFGLVSAALGGLFLTGRALRPLEDLRRGAAEIQQASDLSRRLPASGRDELARLASTFNAMLGRLEDAFERQRRFVADASHELKTPLTIVKGAAELGAADPDATEKSRHLFGRIGDASERTARLVQSLLTLARSDAGALTPSRSEIPVAELFDAVVREARAAFPDGAPIALDIRAETVHADHELLYQVLLNLLENALRHTPASGHVTLGADTDRVFVRDDGPGIAPEHLPRLTERFYRVDTARARKDGGAGLGLAICKSLVEAHGGELTLESAPGEGTCVTATLPSSFLHDRLSHGP